jgi:predicted transcriptional regulator of viral defense system
MRTSEILEFKLKIFTIEDIAKQLKITLLSTKILASRYVKKGY